MTNHAPPKLPFDRYDINGDMPGHYCDICNKRKSDGVILSYWSSGTMVCNSSECRKSMQDHWNRHCEEMEEEYERERRWKEGYY